MKRRRGVLDLLHYGLSFDSEEQLAIARRFYEDVLGFTYIVKDVPRVIWYRMPQSRAELHLYYDPKLPRPDSPAGNHAAFEVTDSDAVERLWQKLGRDGWTHKGVTYRMTRESYVDSKLPGVRKRVHAWDPWNHHLEFWELE